MNNPVNHFQNGERSLDRTSPHPSPRTTREYFPHFYGFRLIAALAIVVLHLRLMADRYGWISSPMSENFELLSLGVDFFFVLSGFLITALVVQEIDGNTFKTRTYYIKRLLRILPLYYAAVFTVFILVPWIGLPQIPGMNIQKNFPSQFGLHLLLVPQIAKSYLPFVPYGGQLWSIGVEIMFYLGWPAILLAHKRFTSILCFILAILAIKTATLIAIGPGGPFSNFLAMSRFEVLAIGGLAYLVLQKMSAKEGSSNLKITPYITPLFKHRGPAIANIAAWSLITLITWRTLPDASHLSAGACFAAILMAAVSGGISLPWLENSTVKYFGEISYGIYVWHFIAIGIAFALTEQFGLPIGTWSFWGLICVGTVVLTIGISMASYHFIERPINALRKKL